MNETRSGSTRLTSGLSKHQWRDGDSLSEPDKEEYRRDHGSGEEQAARNRVTDENELP
jgi:hypothetical protein